MTTGRFPLAFAAAMTIAASALSQETDPAYRFLLHHNMDETSLVQSRMLEPWARRVEENSNHQVAIDVVAAPSDMITPSDLVSQVREGVVDMVWTANRSAHPEFPRTEVIELPFVYRNDPVAANFALDDLFESELEVEYVGVEVMFLHVDAGQVLLMQDGPALTPGDLAGTRVRVPTRIGTQMMRELDATPLAVPEGEIPNALEKGALDGALVSSETMATLSGREKPRYVIEGVDGTKFGVMTYQLSMNGERWDSLPAEIQRAFRDASDRDWLAEIGQLWGSADRSRLARAASVGNRFVMLDAEQTGAFREALMPVVEMWIRDAKARGVTDPEFLVQKARDLVDRHMRGNL